MTLIVIYILGLCLSFVSSDSHFESYSYTVTVTFNDCTTKTRQVNCEGCGFLWLKTCCDTETYQDCHTSYTTDTRTGQRCQTGWTPASTCDTPICASSCGGNSACTSPNTCTCTAGWTGLPNCNTPTCTTPCAAKQVCTAPNTCSCQPGWTNFPTCNTPVCSTGCGFQQTCTAPENCSCATGWKNFPNCDTAICSTACPGNQICSSPGTCSCQSGWRPFPNCDIPICNPACTANQTCSSPNLCTCQTGWANFPACDIPICRNTACLWNQICVSPDRCACPPGWKGFPDCDTPVCLIPCSDGRVCSAPNTCSIGPPTPDARSNVTTCYSSSPCLNSGRCFQSNSSVCVFPGCGSFTCSCPPGYTGRFCNEEINECSSSPCYPFGDCIDGINSYTCSCRDGFQPDYSNLQRCSKYNRCQMNDITGFCRANNGTCIDDVDAYKCICPHDRTGYNCELGKSNDVPVFYKSSRTSGPLAGGTVIIFTGKFLNSTPPLGAYFIPDNTSLPTLYHVIDPRSSSSESLAIVSPMAPPNRDYTLTSLSIVVEYTGTFNVSTNFRFKYVGNPVISDIQPRTILPTGGVYLTVAGERLDGVSRFTIVITVNIMLNGVNNMTQLSQDCTPQSTGLAYCVLPRFNFYAETPDGTHPTSGSVPGADDQSWDLDIHISVGFFLDGYKLYENNRSTIQTFRLEVSRVTPTFNTLPQMPYNPSLKIKGDNLTVGCSMRDYRVQLGSGSCSVSGLTADTLECTPPEDEPQTNPASQQLCSDSPDTLPLVIHIGVYDDPRSTFFVTCVKYKDSTMPTILIIELAVGIGVPVLLIILAIIVACVVVKRRKKTEKCEQAEGFTNMVFSNDDNNVTENVYVGGAEAPEKDMTKLGRESPKSWHSKACVDKEGEENSHHYEHIKRKDSNYTTAASGVASAKFQNKSKPPLYINTNKTKDKKNIDSNYLTSHRSANTREENHYKDGEIIVTTDIFEGKPVEDETEPSMDTNIYDIIAEKGDEAVNGNPKASAKETNKASIPKSGKPPAPKPKPDPKLVNESRDATHASNPMFGDNDRKGIPVLYDDLGIPNDCAKA